jgi:nucleotide-binding universal stress UspA family protein
MVPGRIERILCPVDFSEVSEKAYRYAQSIACHYRAKLILQHVLESWQYSMNYYSVTPEVYESVRQTLLSGAKQELQQLVDKYTGVKPECIVEEGMSTDAIVYLAQVRAANLIVMGTHGRSGFDHLMLGSVTEHVLRHASCPVLAVPGERPDESPKSPADNSVQVRQILCCVDFSEHSQRALQHAFSVAQAYGADLTVLHVLDNLGEFYDAGKESTAAMDKLQKLVAPLTLAPERIHLEVRLGKPYKEILDLAAERQIDLIVTGVRGRNSVDLAVFGSNAYRVIQFYPRPVLTVR